MQTETEIDIHIQFFLREQTKTEPHKEIKMYYLGNNISSYGEQNHSSGYCTILLLVFQNIFFPESGSQVLLIFGIIVAEQFLLCVNFFLMHQIGGQLIDQCQILVLYCKT